MVGCAIWYHLYNLKKMWRSVKVCNFTKSTTPPCVFFTFLKLYKWYQIAQTITNEHKIISTLCIGNDYHYLALIKIMIDGVCNMLCYWYIVKPIEVTVLVKVIKLLRNFRTIPALSHCNPCILLYPSSHTFAATLKSYFH